MSGAEILLCVCVWHQLWAPSGGIACGNVCGALALAPAEDNVHVVRVWGTGSGPLVQC